MRDGPHNLSAKGEVDNVHQSQELVQQLGACLEELGFGKILLLFIYFNT